MTECELIHWLRDQEQETSPFVLKGIGDDCAILDPSKMSSLAVSTDVLVEEIHFRRRWMHPYFLGRKALLVNLSDLAAVGAVPCACLLTLTLPPDLTGNFFRSFMKGFLEEVKRWKTPLVGGDLSRGPCVQVGVTIWGHLDQQNPVYRSTAKPGDSIILIGELGFSSAGLNLLTREDPLELASIDTEDDLATWAVDPLRLRCLKAHFLPRPQIEAGLWFRQNQLANAMIDVSDGLSTDLLRLAQASQLVAKIEKERLPLTPDLTSSGYNRDPALRGGEDYALLVAIPENQVQSLKVNYPDHLPDWCRIGKLIRGTTKEEVGFQNPNSQMNTGFDHFKRSR